MTHNTDSYFSVLYQEEYEKKLQSQEQQKLHSFVEDLSDLDKDRVYNDGLLLLKDQTSDTSNLSCLPSLAINGKMWRASLKTCPLSISS